MPAPKHKPNGIHKPTLSVALPIIIPASNPIPAPKDILDLRLFDGDEDIVKKLL